MISITKFFLIGCFALQTLKTYAQPLQFEPLVDDWMISEEIILAEAINLGVRDPQVASNGRGYFIVWDQWNVSVNDWNIAGLLIDETGHILSGTNISIENTSPSARPLKAVASDGLNYALLWRVTGTSDHLFATRIDSTGQILDPAGIEINEDSSSISRWGFDIEGSDGTYLIGWNDDDATTVHWRIIGSSGELGTTVQSLNEIDKYEPGRGLTINQSGEGFRLISERELLIELTPSGDVLRTYENFIPNIAHIHHLTMASTSSATFFVWRDDQTILGALSGIPEPFPLEATVIVPAGFDLNGNPDVATDGSSYFVMWRDKRNMRESEDDQRVIPETFASRISDEGRVLDPLSLTLLEGPRSGPIGELSSSGTSYLAVFLDTNGSSLNEGDDTIKAKLIIDADRYLILSKPFLTEDGQLQFQFNAAPGFNFAIEHTSDFETWSELTRFDDFSGEARVTDNTSENASRFYRARRVE